MKVRVTDNHIRIRLTFEETRSFSNGGTIETGFNLGNGSVHAYVLASSDDLSGIVLHQDGPTMRVTLPTDWVKGWHEKDAISLTDHVAVGTRPVHVLVEKDLSCKHPTD